MANVKAQRVGATANGKTPAEIARERAAAAVKAGTVGATSEIRINVVPASFVSKRDGSTVVGVRVGRLFLVPEHVDALLGALGISPENVDLDKYTRLFGG